MTDSKGDGYTPLPQQYLTWELAKAFGRFVRLAPCGPPFVHVATGRLVFRSAPNKPLAFMLIELWGRRSAGLRVLLGRIETDRDGCFDIDYDVGKIPGLGNLHLEMLVYERTYTYGMSGDLVEHPKLVYRCRTEETPSGVRYNFGTVAVPYWEYDDGVLPRVRPSGVDPQSLYSSGLQLSVARFLVKHGFTRFKHDFLSKTAPDRLTLAQVQADYPINLTQELERKRPGYTRSDEFVGEQMLNGAHPVLLSKDLGHPGWYRARWNWDGYEQSGRYDLHNVDARFEIRDGGLYPVQITIAPLGGGQASTHAVGDEPATYTPDDGVTWLQAKRILRVQNAVHNALDYHFVQTHLLTEQFAIAAQRNLRRNPVHYLLFPHLREIVSINQLADLFIVGRTGVLAATTGLTPESIEQRCFDVLGRLDWKGWQPRSPLTARHSFARAGLLYWDVLTEHIDWFVAEHQEGIERYWFEVHQFSTDLVKHSVPYLAQELDELEDWSGVGEIDDPSFPRVEVDGVVRALRPITCTDKMTPEDLSNLKEACRFIIFQATFAHSYTNVNEYDEGGDVLYRPLGLRRGGMAPESDLSIAPAPEDASYQLFMSSLLSAVRYGTVLGNEDRDIPPSLPSLLQSRKSMFDAVGFDISTIASRVNI